MNEAIKLAIEKGGLKLKWDVFSQQIYFMNVGDMTKNEVENVVLWPSFWQALGKALGWGGECDCYPKRDGHKAHCLTREWEYRWHQLIYWIAEGKDVDEFFKQLIENK